MQAEGSIPPPRGGPSGPRLLWAYGRGPGRPPGPGPPRSAALLMGLSSGLGAFWHLPLSGARAPMLGAISQ